MTTTINDHTPSPWTNDRGTIKHNGQTVAECHVYETEANTLSGSERDNNARLIAAAPDLLEALGTIDEAIGGGGDASEATILSWQRTARAAIAKATGTP